MSSTAGEHPLAAEKRPLWLFGFVVSTMVGLLFYMAASLSIESDASEQFNNLARNTQKNIESRTKSYANLLRGTASLFQANEHVSREQFHRYVANIALQQNYPGVMNLNYSQELDETQRAAYEAAMRRDYPPGRDGYPAFAIHPPGPRAQYSVLVYIEPIASAPEKYGYDIASRPQIAEALAQSRDSGHISNSGVPVPMDGRPQLTGMAMRLPVYRFGMPVETVEQRRAAYQGSVGIGYDLVTMMRSALADMPVRNVRLTLFDIGPQALQQRDVPLQLPHDMRPIFDSTAAGMHAPWWQPGSSGRYLSSTLLIEHNGRAWQALFSVRKSDLYSRFDAFLPWLALLIGFASTMLLYVLFHTLASSRRRAIQMATGMTEELRASQIRLQLSHQKLRRLAAHADQIKEEERKRIAREIHDDLGQNLLVLRIDADMLASRTQRRHPRLNARARSTLEQIDATIKSVRQIINDLRPTVLDLGVNAAVEWQVAQFRQRTGIACEVSESHDDICLSDQCATALFRILQESLSNISQHANASRVQVKLEKCRDTVSMSVSDNGVGAAIDGRNKLGSFGLVGIEERIKLLGGTFYIESSPGAGMSVHVSVPLGADATAFPYEEESRASG
ncbi:MULTISPECIES: CHASE domain-containing protein [unclassified Janthinobacterium]|uniref:CHASE domain-containing protein n=1 Tax=unclassified Janthinobacterium TaxID=2610881 RepID=UPI000C64784D|nr:MULTISPECIES: CHASE domain-containing protein [unclassified Janthinobacterium]MDO8069148.1 CHASE domain-containing protein [Janthinobacterium sp. SUN206]PIF09566.1 signal transduction histidine kinase [Janthinobacterium sp. 13]